LFAESDSIFKDYGHVPGFCVWKRSTVLHTKVFDSGLNVLSDMSKTTCTPEDVARQWFTRDGQNVVHKRQRTLAVRKTSYARDKERWTQSGGLCEFDTREFDKGENFIRA